MNSAIDAPYQARENGVILEIRVPDDSITGECKQANRKGSSNLHVFTLRLAALRKPGQVILAMLRQGYCIFINTVFQGPVPSVRESAPGDAAGISERICIFPTELEAQREIADMMLTRLQEFIDGERDFEDAMTVEEYVVEVDVCPDGEIIDADGNSFR